nr:hypothetical protein [Tanacetum cinerariifolium]
MNYLEEQMDDEAMINSIQNGEHPLPVVALVSLAGTAPNAIPTLKDPNNETAKDLWDALERQMRGSEYGEQDRKAAILYEYETFKAAEGEQLLDTYLCYLQVINDLKKCGYKKDNYINIDALYNILKKNKGDVNDALGYKKKAIVVTSDPLALVAEKTKEINANMVFMAKMEKVLSDLDESFSSTEETIAEVAYYTHESESESEYETLKYYDNSTNYGLFVNDNNDQEIFHDAIESASENFIENYIDSQKDYDKSRVNHNDFEEKDHLVDKLIQMFNHKIAKGQKRIEKANQQRKYLENQNKDLQEKYDVLINQVNTFEEQNNEFNEQVKVLNEKNADLLAQTKVLQDKLKVKHVVIYTHTECQAQYAKHKEERYEYMIRYSALCDNDKQHSKKIDEQDIFFDKMSHQLVEMNNNVLRLLEKILEKETKISKLEGCVSNKDVEIKKCLERLNKCENKLHKIEQTNQTIHMIMPSKDTLYNGYTPMFLTYSDKALEIEKFKRARENKIEFAYDYGNLNASYVNEKIKFSDDYFQEIINLDFKKIDSSFQQTCSLKPYVPTVILEKIIIDLEDEVLSLLEKEKANLETIESLKLKDSQMHNNIMAAGSRDRPPMLAPGRYPQWHSRFLRYVDTRPNGEALRKCILSGPYKPTNVLVQAVEATDNSSAVPEHTTVETPSNMSPENKAHFLAEKEAIHLILTGMGDDSYSIVDAFQTTQEMWEAIERLQQDESLNIQDVKTNLFWEFGKFTSHDGESMESYYTRFYKLMNDVTIRQIQWECLVHFIPNNEPLNPLRILLLGTIMKSSW